MIPLLATLALATTRDEVLAAAADYVWHPWQMTAANRKLPASCKGDPGYTSQIDPGSQVGVAYAWGGRMSIAEFDRRILAGFGAGSHHRDGAGIASCVAGVDCSGYVTGLWGTATHVATADFAQISSKIGLDELLPGDALVKYGEHVVLYVGQNDHGDPVYFEAAGVGRVRMHAGWSYVAGYTPVRYDAIDAAPVHGTRHDPWPIRAFPHVETTRPLALGPDAFAFTACKNGTAGGAGGMGQALYAVTPPGPGMLTVTASGPDRVVIRALDRPSADACTDEDVGSLALRVTSDPLWVSIEADLDPPVSLTFGFVEDAPVPAVEPPEPVPDPTPTPDTDSAPPEPARPFWMPTLSRADLGWVAAGLLAGIALRRRVAA